MLVSRNSQPMRDFHGFDRIKKAKFLMFFEPSMEVMSILIIFLFMVPVVPGLGKRRSRLIDATLGIIAIAMRFPLLAPGVFALHIHQSI